VEGYVPKGQQPLNEIAEVTGIEPQTALFHLKLLEEAGLVSSIFDEGRRYYVLESRDILERLILRDKPPKPVTGSSSSSTGNVRVATLGRLSPVRDGRIEDGKETHGLWRSN
jgi:DNA-binding transcriptional ArsR family regulator